jgi:hypothetical protein
MRLLSLNLVIISILIGIRCIFALAEPVSGAFKHRFRFDEILVQLKPQFISLAREIQILELHKIFGKLKIEIREFKRLKINEPLFLIRLEGATSVRKVIKVLVNQSEIEFAEPNYLVHLENDPLLNKNWNLKNSGQKSDSGQQGTAGADIEIEPVWQNNFFGMPSTIVALIDTGVDWYHEDLQSNIYANIGESGEWADNGIDDDKNGYIDDIHGWNFVNNNNQSQDDNRHGTHCAGIIGARGNNEIGIAGINWYTRILPIKFINRDGEGAISDAIEGMNYATQMGAQIFNSSWGNQEYSKALRQAIERADNAGVLFVAAAGNSKLNSDLRPTYPSGYQLPNMISVASSDRNDAKSFFSNYGFKTVHLFAPGSEIFSTLLQNTYGFLSGTSMAAPHVAGVAALLLSHFPELSHLQIKDRILKNVDLIYGLKGFVQSRGRLNAWNVLQDQKPRSDEPIEDDWHDFAINMESEHPYLRNANQEYVLQVPGAKKIRLFFKKIELESGLDSLLIRDQKGVLIHSISGNLENFVTEYIRGEVAKLNLISNNKLQKFGFVIEKAQYVTENFN